MAQETSPAIAPFPTAPPWVGRVSWAWLGVVPFFAFALMFLILPTGLPLVGAFPDSAHGADHGAGDRRTQTGMARSVGQPRREHMGILALYRAAGLVAAAAGSDIAPLRQRLWRRGHGLRADRELAEHRHDRPVRADSRRCAAQSEPRLRAGLRDDSDHRLVKRRVP